MVFVVVSKTRSDSIHRIQINIFRFVVRYNIIHTYTLLQFMRIRYDIILCISVVRSSSCYSKINIFFPIIVWPDFSSFITIFFSVFSPLSVSLYSSHILALSLSLSILLPLAQTLFNEYGNWRRCLHLGLKLFAKASVIGTHEASISYGH